jgi:murein DD-endopeptidase MepM/ murein hydrolase activator NlpD
MFKKIFIAFIALTLVCISLNQTTNTQAAPSINSSQSTTALPTADSANSFPPIKRKIVPKIVNGELDLESNIVITGVEKQNYDKCRETEKQYRSVRNKNKPTTCFKQPQPVNDEFTDQVYSTLFDQIQEKKDEEVKKDMKTELKLSDFIDVKKIPVCNEKEFKDGANVLSKLGLDNKTFISECNSLNNLPSSALVSSVSSEVVSSSLIISSVINSLTSQGSSQVSNQYSTHSKTTFLDLLFGSVKADAAGTIVYDYRFPYPKDTNVSTYRTFNDLSTHANHNAIDFYSINNNGAKFNADVVAARAGTIYLSNSSTGTTTGLGNNFVLLQDDGNYALYAHLSGKYVTAGQQVARGQKIGIQGDTGTHYDNFDNSHLHFEVLQPGILNYSTACQTDFNNCYNAFTLDQYKVYPAYDECFVGRGGTQNNENNCKWSANGGNSGYPWISQSSPKYWTSINTAPSTATTQNVLFRDVNSGNNSIWKFSNTNHTGDTAFPNNVGPEWKVAGFGDFNADGYQDILWRNSNSGQNVLWEMQNGAISKDWGIISTVGLDFSVAGIGDFNGDGYADILWRNTNGVNVIWNYNRNVKIGDYTVQNVPTDWKVVSVADFNNDGKADILWRNNNGTNVVWNMNNSSIIQNGNDVLEFVDNTWYVAGVADFNGDYKQDIFWRNNNGSNIIWNMNNRVKNASLSFSSVGNDFIVGGLGDFNQDGKADIFWRSQNNNQNVIWNMNNATIATNTQVGNTGASNTQVKGIFAK